MLCDLHQRLRLPPSCSCRRDCVQRRERCVWTQRTPPIWLHSPQCAECNHVGGRAWVRPVRRRRWTQFCGIERGRFRRMPDGDRRTRRATSLGWARFRRVRPFSRVRNLKPVYLPFAKMMTFTWRTALELPEPVSAGTSLLQYHPTYECMPLLSADGVPFSSSALPSSHHSLVASRTQQT